MMNKYKSDRELLAEVAEACGLPVWAKDIRDVPHSQIIDDAPKTKACLIALALRADERDEASETKDRSVPVGTMARIEDVISDYLSGMSFPAGDASAHNDKRQADKIRFAAEEIGLLRDMLRAEFK